MTITVTSDLTDISSCDLTTSGGTHYRLNGTNSANPAADADAYVQGSGCIANKLGATSGATDVGGHFNHTTTFDITNKHLFHWRQIVTAGNMETKANKGIAVGLTNTSTTSNTAWSTTNYKLWYLDGKDTIPAAIGWTPYVLDPTKAGDLSAGTLTLTSVKNVGLICRQVSGVTTTVSNQFYDAIRMGTGLTATASSSGDTITFQSLYDTDKTTSNAWGIITQNAGIYYGSAKMTIGATGQTNTCLFKDTNQVLVWRNQLVADTLYEFNLLGASGQVTTFQLGDKDGSNNTSNGCVVRGQGTAVWTITCGANTKFLAYSCSLSGIRSAALSSTSELRNTSVANSGTIDVAGATIIGCSFSGQTATQLKVDSTSEMSVITNSSFTSGGTGHAIELTATGSHSFTNLTFNSFGADGTTNAAVYNNSGGAVTINVTGGTTPTVRNGAGASTTVVSGSVTVTVRAVTEAGAAISGARAHLEAAAGGPFPANATVTISNSGTTATVTHTAHGMATSDKIVVRGASLDANNGVFTITKINDNSYSYTMGSTPGSSPTGTITSTFVVVNGTTNVSGEISMSRVFPSNQPVTGQVRKSSSAPYYKNSSLTGTVSSSTGATVTGVMISDD